MTNLTHLRTTLLNCAASQHVPCHQMMTYLLRNSPSYAVYLTPMKSLCRLPFFPLTHLSSYSTTSPACRQVTLYQCSHSTISTIDYHNMLGHVEYMLKYGWLDLSSTTLCEVNAMEFGLSL